MSNKKDTSFELLGGVFVSATAREKFSEFERNYLAIREKEKRILSIEEIKKLPFVSKNNPDSDLWKIRRNSIDRFLNYLSVKSGGLSVLDIGCGNGFFSNLMASKKNIVTGVDVNLPELQQAAKAFPDSRTSWYYADILNEQLPQQQFDIITFCTSFHYFSDPVLLLKICQAMLGPEGEIHIIDSPFYDEAGKKSARLSSEKHFSSMGVSGMTGYYHHNTFSVLNDFRYEFKYRPGGILNRLLRIKDSPFPWIVIKK